MQSPRRVENTVYHARRTIHTPKQASSSCCCSSLLRVVSNFLSMLLWQTVHLRVLFVGVETANVNMSKINSKRHLKSWSPYVFAWILKFPRTPLNVHALHAFIHAFIHAFFIARAQKNFPAAM